MKTKIWFISRHVPMCLAVLALLGMSFCAMHVSAQVTNTVVANFDDGVTTTAVDGFEGMAGDGWSVPWQYWDKTGETTSAIGLESAAEIYTGTGNYLNAQVSSTVIDEDARILIGRGFEDGIDLTRNYTVGFTIRINEAYVGDEIYSSMNHRRDHYLITCSDHDRSSADSHDIFRIAAGGTNEWWGDGAVRKWAFVNGGRDGSSVEYIGSDIPLVEGGVYDFTLFVDAQNFSYNATVTDGTNTATINDLAWVTDKLYGYGYLNFIASCDTMYETRDFSIDNIYAEQTLYPIGGVTEVVANFDDGNSETAIDGFTGKAGNGWKTPWVISDRDDPIRTSTVMTSADAGFQELHAGDGNYLQLTLGSEDAEDPEARIAVTRSYVTEPGIDYTKDHTIEFTVRIDETNVGDESTTTMTGRKDRYAITLSDTSRTTPGSADRFSIMAAGNGDDWGDDVIRQWAFRDGDNDGDTSNDVTVGTGIALTEGGVYDFTIFVDVDEFFCDITVTDGTDTFTAEDLGWITSSDDFGGFLNFMTTCDATDDLRGMSIDNIRIAEATVQIPGDANGDGQVDGSDVTILANNWQAGVGDPDPINITFAMGDFNGDGQVDGSDVTILANNWQYGVTTAAAAVPEPSTLVLLFAAAMSLYVVRRRK